MRWFTFDRTPGEKMDPDEFQNRALQAATLAGLVDSPSPGEWLRNINVPAMMVVAERHDGSDRLLVCFPQYEGDEALETRTARELGGAVQGVPRETEPPSSIGRGDLRVVHSHVKRNARLSRASQDGADVTKLTAPEDGFVCLTARRLGRWETERVRSWVSDETNSQADGNKLRKPGVAAVRVTAGSPSLADARTACQQGMASLRTGLDHTVSWKSRPGLGLVLLSGALFTAVLTAWLVYDLPVWPAFPLLALLAVSVLRLLRLRSDLPGHEMFRTPRHYWWAARKRTADSDDFKSRFGGDDRDEGAPGRRLVRAYALQRSSLPVPPGTLAALCAPERGKAMSKSGATFAADGFRDADGPLIGYDAANNPVRLRRDTLYGGVAIVGEAGSGKTNLTDLLQSWLWSHEEDNQMLSFEVKTANRVPLLRELSHGRLKVIDMMGLPGEPVIDMLGPGDIETRAQRFADLVRFAYPAGSVMGASLAQLHDAALVGQWFVAQPKAREYAAKVGITLDAGDGWLTVAHIVLLGRGVQQATMLLKASDALRPPAEIRDAYARLLGERRGTGKLAMSDTQLMNKLSAPLNKVSDLLKASPVFDVRRPKVTWDFVLQRRLDIAIVLSVSTRGVSMPAGLPDILGPMLLKSLRESVERVCGGWQREGRSLTVVCDELSMLSADDGSVVAWMREKGREFGTRVLFATQNPRQLNDEVRNSFLGYMTVASFLIGNPQISDEVAAVLDDGTGEWTGARVRSIAKYHVALKTRGKDGPLPTAVVRVPLAKSKSGLTA